MCLSSILLDQCDMYEILTVQKETQRVKLTRQLDNILRHHPSMEIISL
jgi:hypothetical protein